MEQASILKNLSYGEGKPAVTLLLETPFSKEVRIALRAGQTMPKHQTPHPIVIEIFEGRIEFGVNEETYFLLPGHVLSLEGGVPHDVKALNDSIIRLTIAKQDSVKRVESVAG